MKFSLVPLAALLAVGLGNPVPAEQPTELAKRTTKIDSIFAEVQARAQAAVKICVDAKIDASAALAVREELAAWLKGDLEACADLFAEASAEIEASAEAEVVAANGGCDSRCAKDKLKDYTEKFCGDVEIIVQTVGEDCAKKYVKPCFASFTKLLVSLDGVFAGVAASAGAAVSAVLGASLGLSLGLGLDLGLGLGLGLGR